MFLTVGDFLNITSSSAAENVFTVADFARIDGGSVGSLVGGRSRVQKIAVLVGRVSRKGDALFRVVFRDVVCLAFDARQIPTVDNWFGAF